MCPLLLTDRVRVVFSDPNNWDVENVDFTVGGTDTQDFYQTDAWGGFDPRNSDGNHNQRDHS